MSFYGKCQSEKQMKAIKKANYLVPILLAGIIGINYTSNKLNDSYDLSSGLNDIKNIKSGILENCTLDNVNTNGKSVFCKINNGEYQVKFDSSLFDINKMKEEGLIDYKKYGKAIKVKEDTKTEYMSKPLNAILSTYYNYVIDDNDTIKNKEQKVIIYKLGNIDDQKRLKAILDLKEDKIYIKSKEKEEDYKKPLKY